MSKELLKQYIRMTVREAHLARVPNQLVSTSGHEGETDEGDADVNEFAAAGAGGANTLGAGGVMGYSGPLGAGSSKKKKRTKK
jgi:hypothetical protein